MVLQVIEAHQHTNTPMPVNLKMCFEGMEESGSNGLEEVVVAESKKLFSNVDAVCIRCVTAPPALLRSGGADLSSSQ